MERRHRTDALTNRRCEMLKEKKVVLFETHGGRDTPRVPRDWEAPVMSDAALEFEALVYQWKSEDFRRDVPFYRWLDMRRATRW